MIVDLDLCKKLVEVGCVAMLEGLEEKLRKIGVSGFVTSCANLDAITDDAFRIFGKIAHRYCHSTSNDRTYLESSEGMGYVHSFRWAACLVAANESIQGIRNAALEFLERQVANGYSPGDGSLSPVGSSSGSSGETFGAFIAGEAGDIVAAALDGHLEMTAGCSIL